MGIGVGVGNEASSTSGTAVLGEVCSKSIKGLGGSLSTGGGEEPKVEWWVLIFIEGRSNGTIAVNICIEIAPRRMRIASLRDMTRLSDGIIVYRQIMWLAIRNSDTWLGRSGPSIRPNIRLMKTIDRKNLLGDSLRDTK
jgi:hypothetical protein